LKSNVRVWLALFLVMACFAANSVITSYLVLESQVSPIFLTVVRFVSGLGTLLMLISIKPSNFRHDRTEFSCFLGSLFLGVYAFSISYGYLFIPVAAGTIVFYMFVVLTMVSYSVVRDHEKLTFRLTVGQILGLLGVLIITFSRIGSLTFHGVLLMAVTGTSWGLYSAYGKKFENAFSYTYNSFLIFGVGAIIASVVLWFFAGPISKSISVQDLGLALYMGMVSAALSYVSATSYGIER